MTPIIYTVARFLQRIHFLNSDFRILHELKKLCAEKKSAIEPYVYYLILICYWLGVSFYIH